MIFKHIGAIKHITNMIFKKRDDLLHKIGGNWMKQQVSKGHVQCTWPSGHLGTIRWTLGHLSLIFPCHLNHYVAIAAYKYVANSLPFKKDVDMLLLWNVYVKEWYLESFGFGLCPLLWFELGK